VPVVNSGIQVEGVERTLPTEEEPVGAADPAPRRETRSAGGSLSAPPRRRSRTPGKEVSRGPESGDRPAKSTKRLDPRPPTVPENASTPVPFRSAVLRRSPPASQGVGNVQPAESREPEEPELPLTPTQRGLEDPVVTTAPSGIHNTPSKRPKRSRGAKAKNSPLKPGVVAATEKELQNESEPDRPGKRRKASPELASRHLAPPDPYAEKKKLRDQLLEEVQVLQSDIAIAEKENERLRRYYSSSKGPPEPALSEETLDLLVRTTADLNPKPPPPKPASLLKSIGAFLPFAPRPRLRHLTPLNVKPPPSHLPITLEDQLPYLKAFTPLTYTSTITILPVSPPSSGSGSTSSPILQSHAIKVNAPSGLFAASLSMTVDTSRFSVASLSIISIDPNAEAELGRWARDRASGKSNLGRDVSAICWAMSSWYEVATKRAKFWCEVERRFGTDKGRRKSNARLRLLAEKSREKRTNTVSNELAEGVDADDTEDGEMGDRKWTRKQLLSQMSRTVLVLSVERIELSIEWNILFDWTGEAESSITASARVPSSCESQSPFL
jgi:hypothetical protein